MNILITGGTGFLGKSLLNKNSKYKYILASRKKPTDINFYKWINLDLSKPFNVSKLPTNIDGIVHLAQSKNYRNFPDQALDIFNVNVSSTAILLEWARKAEVSFFINASTGSIYGPSSNNNNEKSLPTPKNNYYAATKIASEHLVNAYSNFFNTVNLRFYGIYGPNMQKDKFIFKIIDDIKKGNPILLKKHLNFDTKVQLTYIDDAIKIIEHAIIDKWNGVVNIASDESILYIELINIIAKKIKINPVIEQKKSEKSLNYLADITLLKSLIPGINFTKVDKGISSSLDNLIKESH